LDKSESSDAARLYNRKKIKYGILFAVLIVILIFSIVYLSLIGLGKIGHDEGTAFYFDSKVRMDVRLFNFFMLVSFVGLLVSAPVIIKKWSDFNDERKQYLSKK